MDVPQLLPLRKHLAERLTAAEKKGHVRIVFAGPQMVKEFVDSIIKERKLDLTLTAHLKGWEDLSRIDPESFDIVLLFDGSSAGVKKKIAATRNIPGDKLLPLW